VDMRDEKMNVQAFIIGQELVPERPDPGPGINDDNASDFQGDLYTGGVAAIKDGVFAGNSNGAACTPKLDSHNGLPGTT